MFGLFLLVGLSCAPALRLPGPVAADRVLLPNGWSLSPAGSHVPLGELPLNIAVSVDGQRLFVTNNGTASQELTVIDAKTWTVRQTIPLHRAWLGLAVTPDGKSLLLSAGNDNAVLRFAIDGDSVMLHDTIALARPLPDAKAWIAGIAVHPDAPVAYAVSREDRSLRRIDLTTGQVGASAPLPAIPYTCLLDPRANALFVSLWGGAGVAVLDPVTLGLRSTIPTADHPCDMAVTPDGARLFVACANANEVDVIDLHRLAVSERLTTALVPRAEAGSTPNAVAIAPSGTRLAVANADNNCLALFDISIPGASRSLGFVPTGWYPTCVRFHPTTGALLVASAKGLASAPNPRGPGPYRHTTADQYSGSMLRGVLSIIPDPSPAEMDAYTAAVYLNTPLKADSLRPDTAFALWSRPGHPSPIRHVFYVIKENRTYDQVFGDMPEGNGDPSLCLFPDSVTPNHHALAREFTLFDNLYCDAEVSADGHNWSMAAYATDYTEKSWPTSYGGRGGEYEFEGGYPIVYPTAGYLWDNCQRHGVSYRSYGEFAENAGGPDDTTYATTESLKGHVAPHYRSWDLEYSDELRVAAWEKEFTEYERNGNLPQCMIVKLPNDHTAGTKSGILTPWAMVAQNDLALGRLVERISHSPYWKESAIFVIEDDAQNGADHVDAHRTVGLMISPFNRRHAVDSHLYSTSSLVRTIGLILGLPPLSQFDAAARPMDASLGTTADLTPFLHRPARIDITAKNPAGEVGQWESDQMDFSREDAAPMDALNRVLWAAIRGTNVPMPPPVHGAFVRVPMKEEEED